MKLRIDSVNNPGCYVTSRVRCLMKRKKGTWKSVSNVHKCHRLLHPGAHAFKRICVCVCVDVFYISEKAP